MVNVKVIKAKNAIISFGIIAFLLMSLIKIIVIGKNKIKEVSLVPLIEDTIILANGNSLKEFKSMDRDNTEKILASELQMSKYIKEKEIHLYDITPINYSYMSLEELYAEHDKIMTKEAENEQ